MWFLISRDSLLRLTKILLYQIPDYNVAIEEEILYYETNLWLWSAPQTVLRHLPQAITVYLAQ